MPHAIPEAVFARARPVRLVIFDVDGVLTDGRLFIDDLGQEYKAFYARDGLGMKVLQKTGVALAVITARSSEVVRHRMTSLGIDHVYQGRIEKLPAYEHLLQETGLAPEQTAYVGDDWVDAPVMRKVGLAVCVADAEPEVARLAHWQTPRPGGLGAARDVCDLILRAQGTRKDALANFDLHDEAAE